MKIGYTCTKQASQDGAESITDYSAVDRKFMSNHYSVSVTLCATAFAACVILTFTFAGWNVASNMNSWGLRNFPLHPGDEVLISELTSDLSSVMCQQYDVTVDNGRADVYLMDADNMVTSLYSESVKFEVDDYFPRPSRSFHLLSGSELRVSACATDIHSKVANSNATVTVLKVPDAQMKTNTPSRSLNAMENLIINVTSKCDVTAFFHHLSASGVYHVTVGSWPVHEYDGRVAVALDRQYYSPKSMLDACYYDRKCVFDLEVNQNVEVVVLLQNDPDKPEAAAMLSTLCVPRLTFWLCLYGMVPFVVVVTALCCCCCFCRRSNESVPSPQTDSGSFSDLNGLENPMYTLSDGSVQQSKTKTLWVSLSGKEMQHCGL